MSTDRRAEAFVVAKHAAREQTRRGLAALQSLRNLRPAQGVQSCVHSCGPGRQLLSMPPLFSSAPQVLPQVSLVKMDSQEFVPILSSTSQYVALDNAVALHTSILRCGAVAQDTRLAAVERSQDAILGRLQRLLGVEAERSEHWLAQRARERKEDTDMIRRLLRNWSERFESQQLAKHAQHEVQQDAQLQMLENQDRKLVKLEERYSSERRQHGQLGEHIRARQDHFDRLLLKLYDKFSTFEDLISRVEQQEQLQIQSKRREQQLRANCRDLSVELAGMTKNLGLLSETHDDLQRQVAELVPESRRLNDHADRAQQALQLVQVRQEDALEAATGKVKEHAQRFELFETRLKECERAQDFGGSMQDALEQQLRSVLGNMQRLREETRVLQRGFREQHYENQVFRLDLQEDFNELKWNANGAKPKGELI